MTRSAIDTSAFADATVTLPGGTAYNNVTYSSTYGHPVISKTGTTSNEHSAFFVGATPQYAMVVGMFTSSQDTKSADTLLNEKLGRMDKTITSLQDDVSSVKTVLRRPVVIKATRLSAPRQIAIQPGKIAS